MSSEHRLDHWVELMHFYESNAELPLEGAEVRSLLDKGGAPTIEEVEDQIAEMQRGGFWREDNPWAYLAAGGMAMAVVATGGLAAGAWPAPSR